MRRPVTREYRVDLLPRQEVDLTRPLEHAVRDERVAEALEATWVLGFGLALRGRPRFPGWLFGLSVVTGILLAVNVTAIWVGIPDIATLPSAGFLAAWFVGASIGLRREASGAAAVATVAAAPSRP